MGWGGGGGERRGGGGGVHGTSLTPVRDYHVH